MTFLHPYLLLLLLVLLPCVAWYIWKTNREWPSVGVSTTQTFTGGSRGWRTYAIHIPFILRMLAIAAIIVAIARPQDHSSYSSAQVEGTDICIALDISGSMDASDLMPNRFVAAKKVASSFINSRENDNMALVIFSGESLSLLPLTNDRTTLLQTLDNVKMGMLADGTAIGDGLASAINRLSSGSARSKSVILLTDGTNNAGSVAPATAAEIARQKGIRVYTIGVGTNGTVRINDAFGFPTTIETKIDEESLRNIASMTGGEYFRATDNNMLEQVFQRIDQLEKTRMDVERFSRTEEAFMPWLILAMTLIVLELIIRYTVLRRIP